MCISKQLKSATSQHLKELKELVGLGLHLGHQLGKKWSYNTKFVFIVA
jgi:hypothetical protein